MHRFFFFAAIFLLLSCSSEKQPGVAGQEASTPEVGAAAETSQAPAASAGVYSLEIKPVEATGRSTFYLVPQGLGLSDAKIVWLVNGEPAAGQSSNQFKSTDIRKGDRVQAKAEIGGQEALSNVVQIRNSPPAVKEVKLIPGGPKQEDELGVEVKTEDIDGDDVSLTYEWSKNGEPAGNGRYLSVPLKRGDKIKLRIIPFDGEAYGRPVLLEREVSNFPPVVINDKKFNFDQKVFTYQVLASDPDGDRLTYSLRSGPPGMSIDSATGFVKWNVPLDFKGPVSASVLVDDGHGGTTSYDLNVIIGSESVRQPR